MAHILIVDDHAHTRLVYRTLLTRRGHVVIDVPAGTEVAAALVAGPPVDVVLTDLQMAPMDGIEVLRLVKARTPEVEVIVLTGNGTLQTGLEAMRLGAYDYLLKSASPDELMLVIERAVEKRSLSVRVAQLEARVASHAGFDQIVGTSGEIQALLSMVGKVSRSDVTVLVLGESGVGKELVAEAIHSHSARSKGPFIPINCGALPRDLQESELFGHVRGSFTGASVDQRGKIEAADRGTVFLDEIGEMDPSAQVKLLRFLQNRELSRVGEATPRKVDVRVVAATNRDLQAEVAAGRFREDLYYRLAVVELTVPALRERPDDIPMLWSHFLRDGAKRRHMTVPTVVPEVRACVEAYSWPGNVRELQNAVERALTLMNGSRVELDDLPPAIRRTADPALLAAASRSTATATRQGDGPTGSGDLWTELAQIDGLTLADLETRFIQAVMAASGGGTIAAAKRLGISRVTLWRRLKALGLIDSSAEETGGDASVVLQETDDPPSAA